jgi:hypothetical protein
MQQVRYWALDSLFWTSPQNGCDLAQAFELLDDPSGGIRRKVLNFLSRISIDQINAAYECPKAKALNSSNRTGLGWLLSGDSVVPEKIEVALKGHDQLLRRYGVVAAARLRKANPEPLIFASGLDDADVREFAKGLMPDQRPNVGSPPVFR